LTIDTIDLSENFQRLPDACENLIDDKYCKHRDSASMSCEYHEAKSSSYQFDK